LSETTQEDVPGVLTSSSPDEKEKDLNAEVVTTMATAFLNRIGHKSGLKPKRVTLDGDLYTVEIEMKKMSATVKVDLNTHEIKEYDLQPTSEEGGSGLGAKAILPMFIISSAVTVGVYFGLQFLGF
jgi:hypothetical protein